MSLQPFDATNVQQVEDSVIEVINPVWTSLSAPAYVDNSITMQEYRPINDSTSSQNFSTYEPAQRTVKFDLVNNSNYLHLSKAKLITTMRLVRDGGVDIAYAVDQNGEEDETNSDAVALSNLISTNIFDSCRLTIGDRIVQSVNHADLSSFIKVLTSISCEEYKTKSAEMFLYAKGGNQDNLSSDGLEEFAPVTDPSGTVLNTRRNRKYNRSFVERRKRSLPEVYYDEDDSQWKVGKYHDIQTTIDLKYLFTMLDSFPNLLLRNSKIEIEFTLTGNKQRLVDVVRRGDGYTGDYHVWIKEMKLFVPELQPNNATRSELNELYKREMSQKYIFPEPTAHLYNAHQVNVSEIEWRITSVNSKPENVFIIMKRSDRTNNYTRNYQIFDNANVDQISVNVGAEVYPRNLMKINFEDKKYNELYMRFLDLVKQTRQNYIDEQSLVTYERFLDTYTIFWFDVSRTAETSYSEARDITLNVKFKDPSVRYDIFAIIEKRKTLFLSLDSIGLGGRITIAG